MQKPSYLENDQEYLMIKSLVKKYINQGEKYNSQIIEKMVVNDRIDIRMVHHAKNDDIQSLVFYARQDIRDENGESGSIVNNIVVTN